MRRSAAKFVPRLLSEIGRLIEFFPVGNSKKQARDEPNFISNIITGDETWVYGYDP
jgi:hypothetical protein